MNKETYDLMVSLGFEFLNYPPKTNQTEPNLLQMRFVPSFGPPIIYMMPHMDLEDFMSYFLDGAYSAGYVEGLKDGRKEVKDTLRNTIKNLLDD